MRTLKGSMLVVSVLAFALVAAGCGSGQNASTVAETTAEATEQAVGTPPEESGEGAGDGFEGGVVRVGYLPVDSFAPLFVTAEMFAEQEGITVEMLQAAPGSLLSSTVTGEYDVAVGGGASLYNAHNEGLPFEIVAPQHLGYPEDYWTLSSTIAGSADEAASVAEGLSDLAGEPFAIHAPGVATEYMLAQMLNRGGLSIDDVEVRHIPFPDMIPALASGAVAGAILSPPLPTVTEQQGAGYQPFPTPGDQEPLLITVLIYNSDWSAANPELAAAYMRAYQKAAAHLEENGWDDPAVLDAIASYTELDPELIKAGRDHYVPGNLDVDLEQMAEMQRFFLDREALDYTEPVDDAVLWNFEWRDRALEDAS